MSRGNEQKTEGRGQRSEANPQAQQLSFSFTAPTMTPLGDGSFRLTPGKMVREMTPLQAAPILGVCRNQVYVYIGFGLLPFRKPAQRKILIPAEAVEKLRIDTMDPEFWDRLKAVKKRRVR